MSVTATPMADAIVPLEVESREATQATSPARGRAPARFLQMVMSSLAVWVLYVPYHTLLRTLGPRRGLAWSRWFARLHWLLTFVGAQYAVRRNLARFHHLFDTQLSVSTLLRKHLEMKHECFARVRVYSMHGPENCLHDISWETTRVGFSEQSDTYDPGSGVIVVGFHFGFFQMSLEVIPLILPGCNPMPVINGVAECADKTAPSISRIALRKSLNANQRSGLPILYLDTHAALLRLSRFLRQGGSVVIAADGMLAHEFIEVPFLDGTLQVPNGWARLAAMTRTRVVVLCDSEIDRHRRRAWVFDTVGTVGQSEQAVRSALAESIRVLDSMIRQAPWAWHPWQRLRRSDTGASPRYYLTPFGQASYTLPQVEQHSSTSAECGERSLREAGELSADISQGPVDNQ